MLKGEDGLKLKGEDAADSTDDFVWIGQRLVATALSNLCLENDGDKTFLKDEKRVILHRVLQAE